MLIMRFPSFAGECAKYVGSNPCFGSIVEKRRNEKATKLGGFCLNHNARTSYNSKVEHDSDSSSGMRDISLVKA